MYLKYCKCGALTGISHYPVTEQGSATGWEEADDERILEIEPCACYDFQEGWFLTVDGPPMFTTKNISEWRKYDSEADALKVYGTKLASDQRITERRIANTTRELKELQDTLGGIHSRQSTAKTRFLELTGLSLYPAKG